MNRDPQDLGISIDVLVLPFVLAFSLKNCMRQNPSASKDDNNKALRVQNSKHGIRFTIPYPQAHSRESFHETAYLLLPYINRNARDATRLGDQPFKDPPLPQARQQLCLGPQGWLLQSPPIQMPRVRLERNAELDLHDL